MADSFYVPLGGDRWLATPHTTGPWDPAAQHGGPPCALLGRAVQRCAPRDDMIVARFTCEILRAIPVGELQVTARLARPGRSVELLEAVASAAGREVARAAAWRVLRTSSGPVPAQLPAPPELPAETGPAGAAPAGPALSGTWSGGYLSAMEWRPVRGSTGSPGPATVWSRMRYPLVPDEEPGPLERVLATADSGNGVSWSWTWPGGTSSTPNSPCTCTGSQRGGGSAWTPRPRSRRAGRDWPPPSCPTPAARSGWQPSRCWWPEGSQHRQPAAGPRSWPGLGRSR
ncbi:MAG: thioesterase family protein [Streptosporangiaceae bacterium]|nr:thioesterase family protein [Streptosporangiaceae bacterium]